MSRMVEPVWKQPQRLKVKRRGINPVGKKGRARRKAWAEVVAHFAATNTQCWACDVHHLAACNGRYEHTHHILPRSAGGPDTRANALPVSLDHHHWIHRNPEAAYALGLLERRGAVSPDTERNER